MKILSISGHLIYDSNSEITIKDCLLEAIKSGANLRGANLSSADNKELAYMPMYCKWSLSIIGNKIKVGCEAKTSTEWIKWLKSDEEYDTKRGTEEFKQIEACIRAYITYQKILKSK